MTALRLTRESFTTLLGDLRDVMKHNFNHKVLAGMDMFKGLNNAEREKLIDNLQEVKFARGADVIKQGDAGETFYIVKTGVVKVTQIQEGGSRPETIKEGLSSGDYFGEMALLESQPRMATVTATSDDVVLMSLDRATFTSLLGPLGNILNREVRVRARARARARARGRGRVSRVSCPHARASEGETSPCVTTCRVATRTKLTGAPSASRAIACHRLSARNELRSNGSYLARVRGVG